MAPSATEAVPATIEALKQKIAEAEPAAKAPQATEGGAVGSSDLRETEEEVVDGIPKPLIDHREPLKLSGALDQFKYFDSTPVIGREFVDVDLAEWLRAPNSDELIRDLAITSKTDSLSLASFASSTTTTTTTTPLS